MNIPHGSARGKGFLARRGTLAQRRGLTPRDPFSPLPRHVVFGRQLRPRSTAPRAPGPHRPPSRERRCSEEAAAEARGPADSGAATRRPRSPRRWRASRLPQSSVRRGWWSRAARTSRRSRRSERTRWCARCARTSTHRSSSGPRIQPGCWQEYRWQARMWNDNIGEAYGYGGLGLRGVGAGGGGVGYGVGMGRLGGSHKVVPATSMSRTNNQVAGVDEADIVKTDGRYVYLAMNGALRIVEALKPHVVSVTRLSGAAREMFVQGDRAVVYTSSAAPAKRCTYGYDCRFGGDGTRTKISVFDVDPARKAEAGANHRPVRFIDCSAAHRRYGAHGGGRRGLAAAELRHLAHRSAHLRDPREGRARQIRGAQARKRAAHSLSPPGPAHDQDPKRRAQAVRGSAAHRPSATAKPSPRWFPST